MSELAKNLRNSIWHAFTALQLDQSNTVAKSKLKVLTANIGTIMDLYGVEKGLEHYRSTSTLTFTEYMRYLQNEILTTTDSTPSKICREYENGIEEICWLLCRKMFLDRTNPIFDDQSVYKLFRIFCLLGELEENKSSTMSNENESSSYYVAMHSDEVAKIASHLVSSLGLAWDPVDYSLLSTAIGTYRFSTFLAVLESKYCGKDGRLDNVALAESIEDLYQVYIEDVIKKGYLLKKGYILPTFKYFWFVLKPGELTYYKDSQQKEPSGVINLNLNCWADVSLPSQSPTSSSVDCRFVLSTPEHRSVDLIADDHKGRLQWLAALQIAIRYAGEKTTYQRTLVKQRRSLRSATKQQRDEIWRELNNERQARLAAEIKTEKLEAITREGVAQVQQLEDIKNKLENLLQEEKQALRDEEIVRGLQARVLTEEWEKREQLERLQHEQQQLLEMEKLKRREFEEKQAENERQLREAEIRLKQLEAERQHLDTELVAAREKIRRAEEAQNFFESQLSTSDNILASQRRIRRTQSLIPTTK